MSSWSPPALYATRPVAVLGGGVLGRRIACCWASAGYTVNILDPSPQSRQDALTYVEKNVVSYAKITGKEPASAFAHADMETAVKDAWIVFEAVPEKLSIKIDTFGQLDVLAPQDCILASNSSSYKSGEMLDKVRDETKKRILNTHYMMPPEKRVVELMTCGYTHEEIFPFLHARHKEAGLSPYIAKKESTGFIFNRVWAAIKRECLTVLAEEVSTPDQLDQIWMEMFGTNMGPCGLMDAVGLDTVAFIEDHYCRERGLSREKTVDYLNEHYIKQDKLGLKSEKGGFYPPIKNQEEDSKIIFLDVGLGNPIKNGFAKLAKSGRVLEMDTKGRRVQALVEGLPLPDGIDVCAKTHRLYWSNMGIPHLNDGSVMSANRDGTDVTTIVPPGAVHTPKQLVVDNLSEKLYFADREGLRIMRCNLDGSTLETVVQTGNWRVDQKDVLRWCVGINVSHKNGKIYWTQKGMPKGNSGRIFMAGIEVPDGESSVSRSDVECIVDGLPECIDLELDESTNTLYWTDRGELPFGNTLNRMQLDDNGNPKVLGSGPAKHEIIAQKFDEAIGLKLDPKTQTIFVTDLGGTVWRCNYDGSEKKKVFEDKTASFTGITMV